MRILERFLRRVPLTFLLSFGQFCPQSYIKNIRNTLILASGELEEECTLMSILLKSYSYWPNFSYCLDFSLLRAQESGHYCPATFLFLFSNSKVANSKISLNFLFSALSFCFSLKACRNSVQESFLEQKGLAESFSIVSSRKGKTKQNKNFFCLHFFSF